MSKNHEGNVKQYILLSEAWYGDANLKPPTHPETMPYLKHVDSVSFGFYSPDGGTSGEMGMEWYILDGETPIPRLHCWNDGWHALFQFKDVLMALAHFDNQNITPHEFCAILERCGFVDATPRER